MVWSFSFYQISYIFNEPTMPTPYRDVMDDTFDNSSDHFSKINQKNLTTVYEYNSQEQEFVFCCKGKPFATLVSSNLPTPTCNLIDFDLVRDLGLKMTDLQCRKFYFAGNKFRVLGKVSTTVQCIEEGALSGANFHIKGLVVSDLNKTLDSHCVAGVRMKEFLLSSVNKAPNNLHVSSKAPDDLHVSLTVPDDPILTCPRRLLTTSTCPRRLLVISTCPSRLVTLPTCPPRPLMLAMCPPRSLKLATCPPSSLKIATCLQLLVRGQDTATVLGVTNPWATLLTRIMSDALAVMRNSS